MTKTTRDFISQGDSLRRKGDYDAAISAYDEAIKIDQTYLGNFDFKYGKASAYRQKGDKLYESKKYYEAVQAYDLAINTNSSYGIIDNRKKALQILGENSMVVQQENLRLQEQIKQMQGKLDAVFKSEKHLKKQMQQMLNQSEIKVKQAQDEIKQMQGKLDAVFKSEQHLKKQMQQMLNESEIKVKQAQDEKLKAQECLLQAHLLIDSLKQQGTKLAIDNGSDEEFNQDLANREEIEQNISDSDTYSVIDNNQSEEEFNQDLVNSQKVELETSGSVSEDN